MRSQSLFGLTLLGLASAHGDHAQSGGAPAVDENADWMTKHMAGKLHLPSYEDLQFP